MKRTGLPEPILRLIDSLSRLPGIGEKSATRLAFHILKSPQQYAESLAKSIADVKDKVTLCPICYSFTGNALCDICKDEERDNSIICVVEQIGQSVTLSLTSVIDLARLSAYC